MKKRTRNIAIIAVLAAGIVVLVVLRHMASIVKLNDTYVNGNTAGNLYNQGLFCENDGVIYFSNPDDSFYLYSMKEDGSDLKKLSDDVANYINADSNYLYFIRNNTSVQSEFSFLHVDTNCLCRLKKNGSNVAILDHDPCMYASLLGNYIYYLHYDEETATTLYKVKINGDELGQVYPNSFFTCSTDGSYMFYNGLDADHNIYCLDTQTGSRTTLLECNAWMPVVIDEYAYYMDCDHNYALAKTNLSTNETTLLTTDRVDCFNIAGDTVFYQKNDPSAPALCSIGTDGSNPQTLVDGTHTKINAAGGYIYFMDYDDDTTLYYIPAAGEPVVNAFHPGRITED